MTLTVAKILKAIDALVNARPKITYTQNLVGRRSALDVKRRRWIPGKKSDCSLSSAGINYIAGAPINLKNPLWNVNIISRLVATGFYKRIKVSQYKTLSALRAVLEPGDTMRGPGHVIVVRDSHRWVSWEGAHNGFRAPYMRSRKWTDVARLIRPAEFQGRILAAYSKGKSYADALSKLSVRSPYDGPLWAAFMRSWAGLDLGMNLIYDGTRTDGNSGHVFVVLGAGLNANGTLTGQGTRRLQLALTALLTNPTSRVLVTGGKPRSGVTEAAAGKAWLLAHGIKASRILTESAASSTIGNATGGVAVLRKAKATSYTLVSDASHLRRAQVLFLAAQLRIETAENKRLAFHPVGALAVNNYAPGAVITARPVSAVTRATVATEVATLLRLTQPYNQAL